MLRQIIAPRKKQIVLERDGFICQECGANGDFKALEVDHIIPVAKGGTNEIENLQTLCYKCNMAKRDKVFVDQSPIEDNLNKLEIIKARLIKYEPLTINEFKVVFCFDRIFREFKVSYSDVLPLFIEVNEKISVDKTLPGKYRTQRDTLMYILRKKLDITYNEMEKLFRDYDFEISTPQISNICAKFGDKEIISSHGST